VIAPGDVAPDFTLPDQEGRPVTLSELRGQKVVVYFYPKADTPGNKDSRGAA
jgi:thioredoxin-dependent peroxiredoxin